MTTVSFGRTAGRTFLDRPRSDHACLEPGIPCVDLGSPPAQCCGDPAAAAGAATSCGRVFVPHSSWSAATRSCTVWTERCMRPAISRSLSPAATALATCVRRGRAARVARAAVAAQGLGLAAAAFPLDRPDGDPADVMSWVQSWHAGVHPAGFLVVGVAAVAATGALAVAGRAARGGVAWRSDRGSAHRCSSRPSPCRRPRPGTPSCCSTSRGSSPSRTPCGLACGHG